LTLCHQQLKLIQLDIKRERRSFDFYPPTRSTQLLVRKHVVDREKYHDSYLK